MFAPYRTRTMPLKVETCVAQHLGDRAEQQDRVALFPHPQRRGALMAVLADGMGGHSGGAIAAEQVVHKARELFDACAPGAQAPRELLRAVIDEAHLVIKLVRFTSEQDPHTTAAVLMLQPGRIDWAHCGDSRIYHFRGDRLVSRSLDHSFVEEMVRQGRLSPQQAASHPQRNVLMHCLGGDRQPQVDYGATAPLARDDAIMLCSDGLWSHFSDAEMGGVLAAYAPRQAAEVLIARARERSAGEGDNLSLIIIKLTEEEAKPAAPSPASRTPAYSRG
jgi:serine/threonine protein phosphatase PrpC